MAILYTGGAVAQCLNLVFAFGFEHMPFLVDWVIVFFGGYGGAGFVFFHKEFGYRGRWEKPVHWLMVLHVFGSVVVHAWTLVAGTHSMYSVFPYEYSYFAIIYFGFFAWRTWTMEFVQGALDAVEQH